MSNAGALLSEDGRFRYKLWRNLVENPTSRVVFLMLNPSTADETTDDPTIRKCKGFAKHLGFEALDVVNLYAFRATDPADLRSTMKRGFDVYGWANQDVILQVCKGATVIAAWGSTAIPGIAEHSERVMTDIRAVASKVYCLGRSKNGAPRHPLMLAYSTPLEAY